jgi:hypothetical protein
MDNVQPVPPHRYCLRFSDVHGVSARAVSQKMRLPAFLQQQDAQRCRMEL